MAGNPNQVSGRARVTIDGTLYATAGDVVLELGGNPREHVSGDYGSAFKVAAEMPAKLTASLLYKEHVNPTAIHAISNGTITIEFDHGPVWMMRNAYSADLQTIQTTEGKVSIVMQSPPAEQVR